MKVEITSQKVILTHGDFYMSIDSRGRIFEGICFPDYIKVSGFNQKELNTFNHMWISFINKDY